MEVMILGTIMHGVDLHDEKIEIIHGRPVAMAGASIEHDIVSGNIFFFENGA